MQANAERHIHAANWLAKEVQLWNYAGRMRLRRGGDDLPVTDAELREIVREFLRRYHGT